MILGLLLVLVTLALYNPVVHHPFVNFDDDRYVTDNANVMAGLHWRTVKWAFTTYDEANWHPLTWISHALDCQLFGLNPAGHHYINVLLHALNVVLLFWLLWRATGATGPSLMVAALFAVHPVNVESVAWVAERKNVLSMLFCLLALWAYGQYVRKPSVARYAGVAALFACGLMAKPMVITLPFVLLLWDYWPLGRIAGSGVSATDPGVPKSAFSWLALEKLPLLLMSAASAVVTVKAQRAGDAIGSTVEYPISIRIENAIVAYARYVGKAFWPTRLTPIYPHPGNSLKMWQVAAAAILLLGITGLVAVAKRRRYLLVGWLWFLGTLVPMIGLVQVGTQAMADRYAYLPFVGLFIAGAWVMADWTGERHISRAWLAGAGTAWVLALALVAHRQINYWGDNLRLWAHAVQAEPASFIAEDNLGGALLNAGRYDEAMQHFHAAVALDGTDPMSRLNIAADEQRHGHLEQAVEQYNKLVVTTRDPRFRATAFSDMGYAYRDLGDLDRAKQSFLAAVSLRPRTLRAWVGLGLVAQKRKNYAAAIAAYSQALTIQKWDLGYFLLARALEQSGQAEEAHSAMQEARRLSENFEQMQRAGDALMAK